LKPAYYNEIDPSCAQWIRNLISAGALPPGDVDERSIEDVSATDLVGYGQCHFFAGIGGWPLALLWASWPGDQEVWTGSCPCQPFSHSGKLLGFGDERHLWPEFQRLIKERKPARVFGEQVASKAGRKWFSFVRADLEALGYAVGGADLCAAGVGADHIRQRLFYVADAEWDEQPRKEPRCRPVGRVGRVQQPVPWDGDWTAALARFRAMGDGLSRNVAGTDAARNAIVPQVAQAFIEAVMEAA
jgi:DNA (cytosine-5)-methyltransferase 1